MGGSGTHVGVLHPSTAPQRVPGILKQVVAQERLGQLPLFAFGASSGGGFVLRLAQAMPEVQVRTGRG